MRTRLGLIWPVLAFLACAGAAQEPPPTAPDVVVREIEGQTLRITIAGLGSSHVTPPAGDRVDVPGTYDVIVVGGGLSGMSAGWFLRDKNVVVLERKETPGGLAFRGVTKEGVIYNRGSAYYSRPGKRGLKIYEDLGLTPIEKTAISEPIDSYWYKGELIEGVWEEAALAKLPPGFRQFKEALLKADEDGRVHEQPIEEAKDQSLDRMTAAEFIKPFGPELKDFMDSYAQSACGALTDDLNAQVFCNFYLAEIETRYAWEGGTAGAAVIVAEKLRAHRKDLLKTGATVTRVRNDGATVVVEYEAGGVNYRARAKAAILATPLAVTAALMEDFPKERRGLVGRLKYSDYLVHTIFTSKDLFTKSYDTWFAKRSFTDVIATRWQETGAFTKPGKAGPGLLSVYQPLAPHRKTDLRDREAVADLAAKSILELREMVPDLGKEKRLEVESYRWPSSIHIVPPGYFSEWAPKLVTPVGRVYFAGNNLGTPSFEEALYRGWRAAKEIREKHFSKAREEEPAGVGK